MNYNIDFEGMTDDEIEEMFNGLFESCVGEMMEEDLKTTIINFPRYQQMKFAYIALKRFAGGENVSISYKVGSPFKWVGSVTVEAKRLEFNNSEWFARAVEFANNTEVYPLTKDRIRMTLTFYDVTVPIED